MIIDKKLLIKYGAWALAGLLAVIIIVIIVTKSKKSIINKLTEKQQEHINSLEIVEKDLTVPNTELNNLVSKLKTAFGTYGWGTDEESVYEVFEALSSRSDVLALINTFGVYNDHTLPEWMNKELNNEELAHVQEILSAKGIVYTF
jgi:hypothetical protein